MAKKEETLQQQDTSQCTEGKPICGIIMPISPIDGCSAEHWKEVQSIISEAIETIGYTPNIVSDADDSGVIQKRIVQNLYDNEIVVCDVSGKNPNVMFELGMRLAFDKPTIIIMDDQTSYSFDTAPIEHLKYPRNLNYYEILKFKETLKNKINATIEAAKNTSNYSTFLKHFGEFKVANIEHKEGSINEVVLNRVDTLSEQLAFIQQNIARMFRETKTYNSSEYNFGFNERFKIYQLLQSEINDYCKKQGITPNNLLEKGEMSEEYKDLLRHLEDNTSIYQRCGSRLRFIGAVRDVLRCSHIVTSIREL